MKSDLEVHWSPSWHTALEELRMNEDPLFGDQ